MLKGKKVVLREKRIGDAVRDYAWRCDEELARLDAVSPLSVSFSEFLIRHAEELNSPHSQQRRFAIEADGKHIGNCMYFDVDGGKRQTELGVMIGDKTYWGQGYGADAVTTLVRHIFEETDLERVYLHTLDWNIRAQRSFSNCGFIPCGKETRGGQRFVIMEIRRDWLEKPASSPKGKGRKNRSRPELGLSTL